MTCICDARFSGVDEQEYCARGCPNCYCGGMNFDERLDYLRRYLGMSDSALSLFLGVSSSNIDRWIVGSVEPHPYLQGAVVKALAEMQDGRG